jgi:hypothetical protein
MCVLLCANRQVYQWIDYACALPYRDALQLSPVCLADPLTRAEIEGTDILDEAAARSLARGPMLRQPAWSRAENRRNFRGATRVGSFQEWNHPLDALAKACGRLLVLVGWRR